MVWYRKDVTQPTNLHAATTQHQSNTHATTSGETKTATSAHAAVYKVVGPPTINKPAGPAVASGPAVAMGPAIAMGPAVAMGPTAVVEKQVVPTAQPETPLQTVPAERLPVKVQRSNTISAFDRNSKKALLLRWCQRMTQDYDVSICGRKAQILPLGEGRLNFALVSRGRVGGLLNMALSLRGRVEYCLVSMVIHVTPPPPQTT